MDDDFVAIENILRAYSNDSNEIYRNLNNYKRNGNLITKHILSGLASNSELLDDKDLENVRYNTEIISALKESELRELKQFQYVIGDIYQEGLGVEKNYKEAFYGTIKQQNKDTFVRRLW